MSRLNFSKYYGETALKMQMDVPLAPGLVTNAMVNGAILTGTTGAVGVTLTLAHGLESTPTFAVVSPLASGDVWFVQQANGLGWDATNVYLMADAANVPVVVKVEV